MLSYRFIPAKETIVIDSNEFKNFKSCFGEFCVFNYLFIKQDVITTLLKWLLEKKLKHINGVKIKANLVFEKDMCMNVMDMFINNI